MKRLDRETFQLSNYNGNRKEGAGTEVHLFAYSEHPVRTRIRMFVTAKGDITQIQVELLKYDLNERRLWIRNLRNMAMLKLGDKCSRCGIRDKRVLQFNHINGGGSKEHQVAGVIRERRNIFYQDIIEGKRNDINLLCANCNQIYEYEQHRRWE